VLRGEETELGLRMKQHGLRIYALDVPMAYHDSDFGTMKDFISRSWKNGKSYAFSFFDGPTDTKICFYSAAKKNNIIFSILFFLTLAICYSFVKGYKFSLLLFAVSLVLLITASMFKQNKIRNPFLFAIEKTFLIIGQLYYEFMFIVCHRYIKNSKQDEIPIEIKHSIKSVL
jgi:hypothetical protein